MVLKEQQPSAILLTLLTFNSRNFSLSGYKSGRASSSRAVSLGGWKLMIPLIGRLSVNMCTISIPARSMSWTMLFTREDR